MPARVHDFLTVDQQVRRGYDSNQNEQYAGISSPTALDSETKWRIIKRIYDANQNEISVGFPRLTAVAAFSSEFIYEWDERANYIYSND